MSLEVGFEVSKAQCLFFLLLPVNQHLKPSATAPEPCLPVCHYAPCHDGNRLSL